MAKDRHPSTTIQMVSDNHQPNNAPLLVHSVIRFALNWHHQECTLSLAEDLYFCILFHSITTKPMNECLHAILIIYQTQTTIAYSFVVVSFRKCRKAHIENNIDRQKKKHKLGEKRVNSNSVRQTCNIQLNFTVHRSAKSVVSNAHISTTVRSMYLHDLQITS